MDENKIGQKQDWTKSCGSKSIGRKGVGRKLGARTQRCRFLNLVGENQV